MIICAPPPSPAQNKDPIHASPLPHARSPPLSPRFRPASAPALFTSAGTPVHVDQIASLARLASHHHLSEHSTLKYGTNPQAPAPVYIPLTVRRPDRIQQLRDRQAISEAAPWYFPATYSAGEDAEPLERRRSVSPSNFITRRVKAFAGDKWEADAALGHPSPKHVAYQTTHEATVERLVDMYSTFSISALPQKRTSGWYPTSQACTLTHIHAHCTSSSISSWHKPLPSIPGAIKTSETHPITVSILIPKHLIPLTASHVLPTYSKAHAPSQSFPLRLPKHALLLPLLALYPDHLPSPNPNLRPPPSGRMGNLFLSSCPGKKVRLADRTDGRPAICRDLDTDFARLKDAGIGCVICCLDDAELSLLSTPFPAYLRTVVHLGISLVRLPMAEGLGPHSPQILYDRLSLVIREYTLKGVHVLVHCRGGVGRAGVVACAWTMMLGLVEVPKLDARGVMGGKPMDDDEQVMRAVREAVRVVRMRRGAKAIETYEQVAFLRDFVEFLGSKR